MSPDQDIANDVQQYGLSICDERVWAAQPRLDQALGPIELRERRSGRGG